MAAARKTQGAFVVGGYNHMVMATAAAAAGTAATLEVLLLLFHLCQKGVDYLER